MQCPYCKALARVQAVEEEAGRAVVHYLCANPRCSRYRREVAVAERPAARAAQRTEQDAGCGIPTQCV